MTDGSGRRRGWVIGGSVAVTIAVVLVLAAALWPGKAGSSIPAENEPTAAPVLTAGPQDESPAHGSGGGDSSDDPTGSPARRTSVPDAAAGIVTEGRATTAVAALTGPPVPVGAKPGDGVAVALTDLEPVEAEATLPGEIGGPAVRVTVAVTAGGVDLELGNAVVNLYHGADRAPAAPYAGSPDTHPLPARVEAGEVATGVYLFPVPAKDRDVVLVEADVDPTLRVALFEGSVAG